MTSEEQNPEEDEETPFLHRLEMIKDLIEAPDEVCLLYTSPSPRD